MSKHSKQEILLTPSGHEVDKELMKVPVKVSPALQALLSNQIELMEMLEQKQPLNSVFIEQHRLEVSQLEEEIAAAFNAHSRKKEKAKQKQAAKKVNLLVEPGIFDSESVSKQDHRGHCKGAVGDVFLEQDVSLDALADRLSPGLPSSKFQPRTPVAEKSVAVDVKRVALGASIKALVNFMGRDLTEEEMVALEVQVDAYLG